MKEAKEATKGTVKIEKKLEGKIKKGWSAGHMLVTCWSHDTAITIDLSGATDLLETFLILSLPDYNEYECREYLHVVKL